MIVGGTIVYFLCVVFVRFIVLCIDFGLYMAIGAPKMSLIGNGHPKHSLNIMPWDHALLMSY